jgi:3-methyl-2-oxobutanoate hydroxymethyltransferase
MNILDFNRKKAAGEKIVTVTCYDFWSARLISASEIDAVLVGDSAAMVMHGFTSTLPATIEMMTWHTAAVAKGAPNKFIIADLPFLSYRKSLTENMNAIAAVMQAGAHAVKLEGISGNEEFITHVVQSGVPVMGHLGLTPQFVNQLGGFKVQGRDLSSREQIISASKRLQELGCFALVLECVPAVLAREITETLTIPTIGIGAGVDTDGQILVLHDMLGLSAPIAANGRKPKFVREFMNGGEAIRAALQSYALAVRGKTFPSVEESFE